MIVVHDTALGPFDEHLDRAIRQLEQLQDVGDRSDRIKILNSGIIDLGLFLSDEQNLLSVPHGTVQSLDGLFPAHEKRNNHVRVDHDITKGKHGNQLVRLHHFC